MDVIRTFAFLLVCTTFFSCARYETNLESENIRLQKEVDSLSIELQKCEMLLKAYGFDPLTS